MAQEMPDFESVCSPSNKIDLGGGCKLLRHSIHIEGVHMGHTRKAQPDDITEGRKPAGTTTETAYIVLTPRGPRIVSFIDTLWRSTTLPAEDGWHGSSVEEPYHLSDDYKRQRQFLEQLVSPEPPELRQSRTEIRERRPGLNDPDEYLLIQGWPNGRSLSLEDYSYYLEPLRVEDAGKVVEANM